MSYRDYLDEQRKLIRTKKEAREAKNERPRNPRPPRLDPPPARDSLLLPIIIGLCLMLTAAWSILWFAVPAVHGPLEASPTIIIQGTPAEAEAIRAWLAPEIAASNLNWEIIAVGSRRELAEHLNSGGRMDVLIIDQDLAAELYEAGLWHALLKAEVPVSGAFSAVVRNHSLKPWAGDSTAGDGITPAISIRSFSSSSIHFNAHKRRLRLPERRGS